jgi:hypothetical protein
MIDQYVCMYTQLENVSHACLYTNDILLIFILHAQQEKKQENRLSILAISRSMEET